jgi:hypothetical protein
MKWQSVTLGMTDRTDDPPPGEGAAPPLGGDEWKVGELERCRMGERCEAEGKGEGK